MTVRARRVLASAGLVLYGRPPLVDPRHVDMVSDTAQVRGTSGMTLDPIVQRCRGRAAPGGGARCTGGDPGVYGAVAGASSPPADDAGVAWEIVPGVPSRDGAAAALGCRDDRARRTSRIVFCRVRTAHPSRWAGPARPTRGGVSLCVVSQRGLRRRRWLRRCARAVWATNTPAVIAESCPGRRACDWGTVAGRQQRLRDMGAPACARAGRAGVRALRRPAAVVAVQPEHAHVFRRAASAAQRAPRDRPGLSSTRSMRPVRTLRD